MRVSVDGIIAGPDGRFANMKRLVFTIALAAAVLAPASAASAIILIGFPPSPIAPPPTEAVWRVNQSAPVDVSVVFHPPDPGRPTVSAPNPDPST